MPISEHPKFLADRCKVGYVLTACARYQATLWTPIGKSHQFRCSLHIRDVTSAPGTHKAIRARLNERLHFAATSDERAVHVLSADQIRKVALWLATNSTAVQRPKAAKAFVQAVALMNRGSTYAERSEAVIALEVAQVAEPPRPLSEVLADPASQV